jgi:hypothetical protein
VFGCGDQHGYGDYFCDAMEELHSSFAAAGADMVGQWPTQGYEHSESKVRPLFELDDVMVRAASESRLECFVCCAASTYLHFTVPGTRSTRVCTRGHSLPLQGLKFQVFPCVPG